MTTETEYRALLEQARDALDVSRRFVYQDSRPQVDAAFDALNAELAKPVEQIEPVAWMWQHKETGRTGFIEANLAKDWTKLNPRQPLVMPVYSRPPTPAWHDAPTVEGLWLNSINRRAMLLWKNELAAWSETGARWYGPIPQDIAKAEGAP